MKRLYIWTSCGGMIHLFGFISFFHSAMANTVCADLPLITNGAWQIEDQSSQFLIGASVTFICTEGFIAKKVNNSITCVSKNGTAVWNAENVTCEQPVISCNDPGYIENAQRIGNIFTFPHNITYVCKEGYKLIGSATKFCSIKGKWVPQSAPLCEAIVCPELTAPQNGKIISSSRKLHSTAMYECDRHFQLTGHSERTCQEDETWTGNPPACKEIFCRDPGNENIQVVQLQKLQESQKTYHRAGDLVIFKCKYGSHKTSSKCLENGEWSKRPPQCPDPPSTEYPSSILTTETTKGDNNENQDSKVSCDDPGKIKNGDRIIVTLSVNSTVTYKCEEGYILRGKDTLLCMENGKWNLDKLPICVKPLSVPSIIGIVLGVVTLVSAVVGVYFFYKWREKKIRGYGKKSKALTADATDLDEITGLDKGKRPIPVTVL